MVKFIIIIIVIGISMIEIEDAIIIGRSIIIIISMFSILWIKRIISR